MAVDRAVIASRVHHAWTGNRHRDLLGFALGEEFDAADEAWDREAQKRYEEGAALRTILTKPWLTQ